MNLFTILSCTVDLQTLQYRTITWFTQLDETVIMSVFCLKFVAVICYFTMAGFGAVNCQIALIAQGIPQVVSLLENINNTSVASADEMASVLPEILQLLQDQRNMTSELAKSSSFITDIMSLLPQMLQDQWIKQGKYQNETIDLLQKQ